MDGHDPLQFAAELAAKLATRSRHVCAFLGAGVSKACGLPDVADLEKRTLDALEAADRVALTKQLKERNLEQVLSRLRRIAALLDDDQTIDGLSAEGAASLDAAVCRVIVNELDITNADIGPMVGLGAWVARADYRLPVELFTVNYDLLIETALERLRVPYFDGFVGNLRARFQTELVEGTSTPGLDPVPRYFARLWKLHGSVNWEWESGQEIARLGQPVAEGLAAAIYPSDSKYEESRRVPFVVPALVERESPSPAAQRVARHFFAELGDEPWGHPSVQIEALSNQPKLRDGLPDHGPPHPHHPVGHRRPGVRLLHDHDPSRGGSSFRRSH